MEARPVGGAPHAGSPLRLDREARRRIRLVLAAAALALPGGSGVEATRLEGLLVVRADLYLARIDGRLHRFELAGVWAPAAPGGPRSPGYRGFEAKRRVLEILDRFAVRIEALETPGPGRTVPVRLVFDHEGERRDLAVLLAGEGLALRERATVADPAQSQALREAESLARRGRLGMHDGGFQRYEAARRSQVELGEIVWFQAAASEGDPVDSQPESDESGASGAWWVRRNLEAPRDPVDAIRDWGAALGLPADGSETGR